MPFRDPRLANVSPHATCPPGCHSRARLRPGSCPGRLRPGRRHVRAGPGDQRRHPGRRGTLPVGVLASDPPPGHLVTVASLRAGPLLAPAGSQVAPLPDLHLGRYPRGSRGRPRHPGQLHVAGGGPGRRCGRGDRVFLRTAAGDHRDDSHGQGPQHQRQGRPGRRRPDHAERRRRAPHPVYGHLRSGPDLDHLALPGPGHSRPDRGEHHLRRRQLHRAGLRRRGWRGHLRPRRPPQGHRRPLHRQPLRFHRSRPGRGRHPGAEPVSEPGRRGDRQHLHRRRVLQRRRPEQYRGVLASAGQHLHRQPRHRRRR